MRNRVKLFVQDSLEEFNFFIFSFVFCAFTLFFLLHMRLSFFIIVFKSVSNYFSSSSSALKLVILKNCVEKLTKTKYIIKMSQSSIKEITGRAGEINIKKVGLG